MKPLLHILALVLFIQLLGCKTSKIPAMIGEYTPMVYSEQCKNETINYQILFPKDFNNSKKYPLIVFLHGSGERGNDNKKQLFHGATELRNAANLYGAIVVIPQCPESDYWSNVSRNESNGKTEFVFEKQKPTHIMEQLLHLIASLCKERYVDKNRLSIAGLSMGGMGTYEVLWRKPGLFKRAAVICGAGDTSKATLIAQTHEIKIYHGDNDDVVNDRHSREMVEALNAVHANVVMTIYPGVNHNSWDITFAKSSFTKFLFFVKE